MPEQSRFDDARRAIEALTPKEHLQGHEQAAAAHKMAALNDQHPCLEPSQADVYPHHEGPTFSPADVGEAKIMNAYLVVMETPTFKFKVKLHPEMKIETEGNPTWEEILTVFNDTFDRIKRDTVRQTVERLANLAPRGETRLQWVKRIKLALEQAHERQQAAADSGTARMDMPEDWGHHDCEVCNEARASKGLPPIDSDPESDDPISGLPDIGGCEDHGRDGGDR